MAIKIAHPCYDQQVILEMRHALEVVSQDQGCSPSARLVALESLRAYTEDQVRSAAAETMKKERN